MSNHTQQPSQQGTGFFSVLKSLLSGLFGIQTQANQEKDFQQGKPIDFIIAGIIGVVTLLILVAVVVSLVI